MSAMLLRDRLRELLVNHLGVYTLANGETTPAIFCTDKSDAWHNDRKVHGLEVVTVIVPSSKYIVYLKVWEDDSLKQTVDLQEVCALVQQHLLVESYDVIEIESQPELRSMIKMTINSQGVFTFENDFLN